MIVRRLLAACALAALLPPTTAGPAWSAQAPRRDLADIVAGAYAGNVISDARGSSRSDVRISVEKVGPNQVRVTADYPRLPAFTVNLTRAMDTIQNADGNAVFLVDLARTPPTLNVTVDDASWAGVKE